MKSRILLILFFYFSSSLTSIGFAQVKPTYSDAGSWNTLNLDFALNKKFSVLLTQELRLKENYSRLNLLYTEFGLEYAPNKIFKTSLVYRMTDKYMDENVFSYRHRLMWDIGLKYKFNRIGINYRNRVQVEYRNVMSSLTGTIPEWYWRARFGINYQLTKKIVPYFSTEFRYQLRDIRNEESQELWHRVRFQLGVDYKPNKYSKIGLYYLVQRAFNTNTLEHQYITGLEYSVSLKDSPIFKKKKKK